jgi:hypothetical protein
MPFVFRQNTVCDIWKRAATSPVATMTPPDYTAVPCQQMKPLVQVNADQKTTYFLGQLPSVLIYRFFVSGSAELHGWLEPDLSGNADYIAVKDNSYRIYKVLGVNEVFNIDDSVRLYYLVCAFVGIRGVGGIGP